MGVQKRKKILIYRKAPGEKPRQILVRNELKELQELVGGYIETVTLFADLTIICNEEGRLHGLPYNCEVCGVGFVGTILFVGVKGDRFTDVPREACLWLDDMDEEGTWEQ